MISEASIRARMEAWPGLGRMQAYRAEQAKQKLARMSKAHRSKTL